ncbi:MAG: MBL fold metallo-hydrolase [Promethearchaeota archaeon]
MTELEITFLGGAREVGRSCILISMGSSHMLLDAGIKLGVDPPEKYPLVPPRTPSAILTSHAHLDHTGFVPAFVKKYDCPVYATPPTQDISELLFMDSVKISKETDEELPYDVEDVMAVRKHAVDLYYNVPFELQDARVVLHRAGHILGSAMIKLEFGEISILYTGDFTMRNTRTLQMADMDLGKIDVLIIESTYGSPSDKHPSQKRIGREFANAVSTTIKRGGKVIIPVFAVGRAQQVMLMLEDYMRSNYIDQVNVFIDGLIRRVNRVYELYWEWLKPEIQKRIRYTHSSPLESEIFYVVRNRDEVIESDEPCIIITTSGMLEGGPVLHYLKELGNDPNNMVCLTGYQAPKTRGRMLLDGSRELTLHNNDKIGISAEIMAFEFSAHADQSNIHRFISMLNGVKQVLCIHGEEAKTIALAKSVKKLKKVDAYAPKIGETVNLG